MKPLFLSLPTCVLLAALGAAAPSAIAAMDDRDQAGQDVSGSGKSCVSVMGRVVCKSKSTLTATALAPAAIAARLFADGPQLSPRNDARNFALEGFVRSGWPVAVDFLPQPNTQTSLVVTVHEAGRSGPPAGPIRIVMDSNATGGRQLFALAGIEAAPKQGSAGNRPLATATYAVESYKILARGKLARKRSPVEIFGIGAGPNAVGAHRFAPAAAEWAFGEGAGGSGPAAIPAFPVAPEAMLVDGRLAPRRAAASFAPAAARPLPAALSLTQVILANGTAALARPPARAAGVPVRYGYRLRRSFHLVVEDIWQECNNGKLCKVVFTHRLRNPAAQPQVNQWTLTRASKAGLYRLYVRAWLQCERQDFAKCEDQGAFSYGKSAPVRVR